MSAPLAVPLSSDRLDDLRDALLDFSAPIRERGMRYADGGRVGPVSFGSNEFTATIRGENGKYRTGWFLDGTYWLPECTCPVGPECKHAYALALSVLRQGDAEPPLAEPVPAPAKVSSEPDASFAALRRLFSTTREWEREHALNQLLAEAPVNVSGYLPPFPEILIERDPDVLAWRLAQEISVRAGGWLPPALEAYRERPDLVDRLQEQAREVLARELRTWVHRQRRVGLRTLRVVLRLVEDPPGRISVTCEALLTSPRMSDTPRSVQQLNQLRNETRSGTAMLPAEQLQLLDWLLETSAGTYYGPGASNARLRTLFTLFPRSPLVTWAEDDVDDLAARAGIEPGAIVRFEPAPVRLLPTLIARNGESVLELRFLWPDGAQSGLDDVVYLRPAATWATTAQPSLILRHGVFHPVAEEPPPELVDRFAQAGFLPVPAAERLQTIGMLAASFPHLRQTLTPHTRRYDAAPAIAMDLRNDDWMQIRLFAHTGGPDWSPSSVVPGAVAFEFTPAEQAWVRIQTDVATAAATAPPEASADEEGSGFDVMTTVADGAPGAAAEGPVADGATAVDAEGAAAETPPEPEAVPITDVWIEEPNPKRVSGAIAWLEEVRAAVGGRGDGPPWADRDIGWWVFVNRKRLGQLAEAWEDRPSGISFFGTPRIRRLFTGRETIRAKVRVTKSGVDWLTVSAEWEAEGRRLSDQELADLRASNSRFVKLPSGWVRREIVEVHDDTAQLLADVGLEVGGGEQTINLFQLAGARPESLDALEQFGADPVAIESVHALRQKIASFEGIPEVPLPPDLTAELRPYQRHGLDFLAHCSGLGTGAILADDMGLGKTVQALAWILHLRRTEEPPGPSLVVSPASVVHNWAREAERFAPGLRVLLLTSGKERHELRKSIGDYDLVVTNYALLRRDIESWRAIELHTAILDEAQNIKNPDAAVTRAARELRARHRLALTGTPMENRALDLWSILSFSNPGYVGTRAQFASRYDRAEAGPHVRALLSARLRPVLLRRTKEAVAPELPDRIEERVDCEMTKGQRQIYLAELKRSRRLLDDLARDPEELKKNRITILAALTRLRQICCHPLLAGGKGSLGSGKFEALFEMLEPLLAEGRKVLVFSQFVECLKLLATEMRERDMPFHMLTGQTAKRERVVSAFEEDPRACVFLISLKAGGTGLNLTSASYVVVFDPWWNPAVEAQAIDRTHRIGQTRTVIAYRLLTRGTIEEKIFELQQKKAQLVRDVLGEGGFARALTREDLQFLLTEDEEIEAEE